MKYCIDTSSILEAWNRRYPPDNFPGFWSKLEALISDGTLITSDEVLVELERKDDEVHSWFKSHKQIFIEPTEEIQNSVSTIMKLFKKIVDTRTGKNAADPFVIATAMVLKCKVITQEGRTGSHNRPKIPEICEHFNVPCINILELIQEQNWVFK